MTFWLDASAAEQTRAYIYVIGESLPTITAEPAVALPNGAAAQETVEIETFKE